MESNLSGIRQQLKILLEGKNRDTLHHRFTKLLETVRNSPNPESEEESGEKDDIESLLKLLERLSEWSGKGKDDIVFEAGYEYTMRQVIQMLQRFAEKYPQGSELLDFLKLYEESLNTRLAETTQIINIQKEISELNQESKEKEAVIEKLIQIEERRERVDQDMERLLEDTESLNKSSDIQIPDSEDILRIQERLKDLLAERDIIEDESEDIWKDIT